MTHKDFDRNGMRILVAEDDPVFRKLIARVLADEPVAIEFARDGDEAWQLYQRDRHELIITDWQMPGMDGIALCKNIRASIGEHEVQPFILMLTARKETDDLAKGFYEGKASDFLTKPFHPIELLARLQVGKDNQEMARRLEIAMRRNREMALTDALTGLQNRRSLLDLLRVDEDRALRGRQPLSVILADVDRFKSINDEYGHNTGDMVLRRVSDALRAGVRAGDHVGRWGGEEFLVLLPNTDLIQAAEVAERCRALLTRQEISSEDGRALRVSSSFGVASADGVQRPDVMELVNQADKALYWAKEAGRNRVKIYVPSADPDVRKTA